MFIQQNKLYSTQNIIQPKQYKNNVLFNPNNKNNVYSTKQYKTNYIQPKQYKTMFYSTQTIYNATKQYINTTNY